jgi:F-type H+-transporting ATPase subunit delta
MQNPRLASRYAKSLLDLAVEQNSLDATLKDVQLLDSICQESRDFTNMLRSPIIKADKKHAIINAVVNGRIGKITQAFVDLLVNKGRETYMPEIANAFIAQYKEMHNIKTVKLTTAVTIDNSIKEAIRQKVAAGLPDSKIELHTNVDPELIGGFVLEMEDKLFDASVRRDLNDIRAQLLDNSYMSRLN